MFFTNATLILPDRLVPDGWLQVEQGRITALGRGSPPAPTADDVDVDVAGQYLSPGFVDLHVHGGAGHDFMDGTEEAFHGVCDSHLKHGTTSLTPTTTVAHHEQHLAFLNVCRRLMKDGSTSARILGAHFYGPYFNEEAKGCHPGEATRPPEEKEFRQYLAFDCINRATVAPELPGSEAFVRACRERGIGCNAGHSYATFEQMHAAVGWGITHVDHLFCAMSDRARLRQSQTFPMRGGVMEATLFFDELTTEVIADGKHLSPELLLLAYKSKGPDRLALVTDCNRALDMPDGEYIFGPKEAGEWILKKNGVGLMPDGKSLASSVVGMDHCVRTFHRQTGVPLEVAVRMASLTPARIARWDHEIGSLKVGKRADVVILDAELNVGAVWRDGIEGNRRASEGEPR